jgi:hypothetical protein
MKNSISLLSWSSAAFAAVLAVVALSGCQSESPSAATATPAPAPAAAAPANAPTPAQDAAAAAPAAAAASATIVNPVAPPVRIKAGRDTSLTDADGNTWLPDQGFDGGEVVDRGDIQITNTTSPDIYRTEHWGMDAFTYPVPNGKYTVKLHFCETYEGITGAGDRVFSFNVQGQEFKDFDVWAKAGGALHPYVQTVNVEVTDGKLHITFTPNVENPEINGIEILPAS